MFPANSLIIMLERVELSPECLVCQGELWLPLYHTLEKCTDCGFVRARSGMDWTAPSLLYQDEYFQGEEYGDYLADELVHRRNFKRRLEEVTKKPPEPRTVLEVGCAYGLFLQILKERGVQGRGVDICPGPVRYAREVLGVDAKCQDFLEVDFRTERFELVCIWDTIEHLVSPGLYLEKAFHLLEPGGRVAFTTGDIGSSYARWRGSRWRMIHPPTHLHYFSAATATKLMERLGFVEVSVRPVSIYRDLHSVLGNLASLNSGIPGRGAALLGKLLPLWLQRRLAAWVDFGDIMLVTGRCPTVDGL